jgi:ADP-ribosyl-[dinitrogen reductase] hydrolase
MQTLDRFRGCLLGLACGDAVGTTVEFRARGSFPPVTDMNGGGPFHLDAGDWTDDTSLALCLAASLTEQQGFDAADQMQRYVRWMDEGYYSSTGECFDIGNATAASLNRFKQTGEPYAGSTDPYAAGNGSIMRLAPVPMWFYSDLERAIQFAGESSRTTHAAAECVDACKLYGAMLVAALSGTPKEDILNAPFDGLDPPALSPKVQAIADGEYREKSEDDISGSGYVVDSLEAALWCFYTTTTYRDAILRAVNLGDDADTTAAVCGQVAGAYYSVAGIPSEWLERLTMRHEIDRLAIELLSGGV